MNCTDQIPATPAPRMDEPTVAVLRAVAEHFRTVDPAVLLAPVDLTVRVAVESFVQVERRMAGDGLDLARQVRAVLPDPLDDITRGEYVLHLRDLVLTDGHDWPSGDNDPAIPKIPGIPGPRTEPTPVKAPRQPGPNQSATPTCCGRTMRRDGTQWVCGKCRGWLDTGRALLALVHTPTEEATV
ncbi:hypothetical protein [Streptomyces anulatus]|uniref:hypothetical protein n=1 Tax=Streptomyces anulatus TaxID=1892 RepID=UPI003676881B